MRLSKNWQGSRGIMQLFIIQLVCWLACLSSLAFAQFDLSEGVTGSVNFPVLGITCVANLAVFVTSLIRGRLHSEIGARDVLDFLSSPKLKNINGIKHGNGLTTVKEDECLEAASTEGRGPETPSEENVPQTASTEGYLKTASTGGGGPETASTGGGGPETASTEEVGLQTSPSTGGGGLQTVSTEENVLQIASTEGESVQGASNKETNLQTAAVVMLSNGTPNWSMRQFMKSNALICDSILLQFLPCKFAKYDLKVKEEVNLEMFECSEHRCDCIVFWTMKEISNMLARRMPGTVRRLSDSLCLLPCLTCHRNGCNHGRLQVIEAEETDRLRHETATEGDSEVEPTNGFRERLTKSVPKVVSPPVVCGILQDINAGSIRAGDPICICIPMHDASSDVWTELLLRSLRSKDAENRGVRVMASEALEGYLAGRRGGAKAIIDYNIVSFMVPRLTEALINLALTFWFTVDGFSSALVARRTVRDYLVDSKGSGFSANAFLTKAEVKSDASNTQVCEVLTFRGNVLGLRNLSFIVCCVNLISSLGWSVLISIEGESDTSPPLSMHMVVVIIAAIGIVLGMDVASVTFGMDVACLILGCSCNPTFLYFCGVLECFIMAPIVLLIIFTHLLFTIQWIDKKHFSLKMFFTVLVLETVCIVSGSAVAGILGIKGFGRWLYGVVQILVWVKWAVGSYISDRDIPLEFWGSNPHTWKILIYSSAFLLNAILAGVRCKWEPWPWKEHHLFSRKLGP